jgi:predicted dehydrogenase
VLEAGDKFDGKLSLEVGFQLRSAPPFVELVRRLHGGAIGEISFGQGHYFCPALAGRVVGLASPAELRLRRWLHDRVLSGDILVEQNIHVIDICNWVLRDHPVKAVGSGGRKGRFDEGDAWSHYAVTFFYDNDVLVSFSSTQFGNKVTTEVCARFFGPRGKCQMPYTGPVRIEGEAPWSWSWPGPEEGGPAKPPSNNIDSANDEKQKAFIESILSGKFHNQIYQGVMAALSCIMGRTAAYTGKPVTWEETYRSREAWDARINLDRL